MPGAAHPAQGTADPRGARLRPPGHWLSHGRQRGEKRRRSLRYRWDVRVFISSRIAGMEAFRGAAAGAITTLGHTPVRAEEFGASPSSPQQACLKAVRSGEVVVLLLGPSYGEVQPTGLSATHEECREAVRESIPVLVFVQEGVTRDPEQDRFVDEARKWISGRYTADFRTADELRDRVIQALHQLELTLAGGRADAAEMLQRARAAVPRATSIGTLVAIMVAGPRRMLIRPAELNARELHRWLMEQAMFGEAAILDPGAQTDTSRSGSVLILRQREKSIQLDEMGTIVMTAPAIAPPPTFSGSVPAMIEDDVRDQLTRSFRFAAQVLDHIDPVARASDVLPDAGLLNPGGIPWRTRAEHQASPNTASLNPFARDQVVVNLNPPLRSRAVLARDAREIAADLTELIAREVRPRW